MMCYIENLNVCAAMQSSLELNDVLTILPSFITIIVTIVLAILGSHFLSELRLRGFDAVFGFYTHLSIQLEALRDCLGEDAKFTPLSTFLSDVGRQELQKMQSGSEAGTLTNNTDKVKDLNNIIVEVLLMQNDKTGQIAPSKKIYDSVFELNKQLHRIMRIPKRPVYTNVQDLSDAFTAIVKAISDFQVDYDKCCRKLLKPYWRKTKHK